MSSDPSQSFKELMRKDDRVIAEESSQQTSSHKVGHEQIMTIYNLYKKHNTKPPDSPSRLLTPRRRPTISSSTQTDFQGHQLKENEFYVDLVASDGSVFTVNANMLLKHQDLFLRILDSKMHQENIQYLKDNFKPL